MLATAALMIAGGCGSKSYDARLDATLADMRYQKRLNDNLMPAVAKNKFEQLLIYLRPPKTMEQAKEFTLTEVERGRFDLEASFLEAKQTTPSLHVLARVKKAKSAGKKKEPAPVEVGRGDFTRDVLALVNTVYPNQDLPVNKLKSEERKKNTYKYFIFATEDKNVWIYLYKKDPYDVALIFEFPTAQKASLITKIGLCLESFAVGPRAQRQFSGQGADEEGTPAAGAPSGGQSF
jgi:hypothetical protein